jgi:lipoprotein-releasing system permease protein
MKAYIFRLASTYLSARQDNRFINFISLISVIGITLGITVLLTVLSIMNGFQFELRERILGMTSHMSLFEDNNQLHRWQEIRPLLLKNQAIISAAPNINGQALISYGKEVKGILVKGIEPELEKQVSQLNSYLSEGELNSLQPNAFNIILGTELANHLGVEKGDKITLITPQVGGGIVGSLPRLRRFVISGIINVGMHQYDSAFALIHLQDAAKFYRMEDKVSQLQLKLKNLFEVNQTAKSLTTVLPNKGKGYFFLTWQQQHNNFFQAIQLEKRIMFIIIALIIAVAAFNIVSTMVMVVNEKKSTIAILRTQGATQKEMILLFFSQGILIGLLGTFLGIIIGTLFSLNIDIIVPAIETFFEIQFFPADVYYISTVPSDLQLQDIIWVATFSFLSSILATIYPAWRASSIQPSEILRHQC